jgi:hypothetical protein
MLTCTPDRELNLFWFLFANKAIRWSTDYFFLPNSYGFHSLYPIPLLSLFRVELVEYFLKRDDSSLLLEIFRRLISCLFLSLITGVIFWFLDWNILDAGKLISMFLVVAILGLDFILSITLWVLLSCYYKMLSSVPYVLNLLSNE